MCPNPFNDLWRILKIVAFVLIGVPLIRSIIDGTPSYWLYIILILYILILEYNYYFGYFYVITCGVPHIIPSRYEQWKIEQNKTPEEKECDEKNRQRVINIFNDLKEKGCIDKDHELVFRG